ncbi:hypothetical protein ACFFHM_16020 [Halalkalibacter kiskunsagensis]|uniref:Uncharacterized protein n=1 Tax=Halalkalibacter kiskunsagensis TaxID=1548599 RepID=A0ABV6KF64_9BACI
MIVTGNYQGMEVVNAEGKVGKVIDKHNGFANILWEGHVIEVWIDIIEFDQLDE